MKVKMMFGYIIVSLLGCTFTGTNPIIDRVRPITIKVIDLETGNPIPDIPIYYCVETAGTEYIMGVFPRPDPIVYREPIKKFFITNNEGIILIPQSALFLKLYEGLFSEMICINLELKSEYVKQISRAESFFHWFNIHDVYNVEKFYNPIDVYKGFVLYSSIDELNPHVAGNRRKNFNILWNGGGLKKEKESFIVALEKY